MNEEPTMRSDITTKSIETIPAYSGPHELPGIRFRHAREALSVSSFGINVLELDPHNDRYPEHDHTGDGQEEVYVVLRGSAVLVAEGREERVTAGTFVRVAPHVRRKFVTREEGVTLLALGGTPGKPYAPSWGG
jgi:uncharacterized cupin superfamily protein